MKTKTKNAIILTTLACISFSAFADRGERANFRNRDLAERYMQRNPDMNICSEIEKELIVAENDYKTWETKVRSVNRSIKNQEGVIAERNRLLSQRKTAMNNANAKLRELKSMSTRKEQIVATAKANIKSAQVEIPQQQAKYDAAKKKAKKKCKRGLGLGSLSGSCRDAKKDKERAKKRIAALQNQIKTANSNIATVKALPSKIAQAQKSATSTTKQFRAESKRTPSIAKLNQTLKSTIAKRDRDFSGYQAVEDRYSRLDNKFVRCVNMRYEARKAPAFKNALLTLTAEGGCDNAIALLSDARGPAQKEGVNEAYDLVCKSERLIREVEIIREIEVPVPGQCSDNRGSVNPRGPRAVTIEDFFTTGSPYKNNLRNGEELVKVFSKPGARQIKIDIDVIDMEAGYDFVILEDANGNLIDKITNPSKGEKVYDYSTGWIEGDMIKVIVVTDGLTERSGFEINNYQVMY